MTNRLRLSTALPTIIILIGVVIMALIIPSTFVNALQRTQTFILDHFHWLFDWTTLGMVIMCIIVYISPLGKVVIGGPSAQPLLSKRRWMAIVICTTVASGILLWGCAEPLYHVHDPPYDLSAEQTRIVSMSTLFMHWTWSPYSIYTMVALFFALLYYNQNYAFRVAAFVGAQRHTDGKRNNFFWDLTDIICLIALVCGMAGTLGASIKTIGGGLENVAHLDNGSALWGIIALAIVLAFIASAVSGLHKGISRLSAINMIFFVLLIFAFGVLMMTKDVWVLAGQGMTDYLQEFIPRSVGADGAPASWRQSWTTFYWANWMAWAPIAALFLGRIGLGYTVRTFIRVNLVYTSAFSALWMIIFGGVSIVRDAAQDGALYNLMLSSGEESVIFQLIEEGGGGIVGAVILLFIVFISYVTAADSNTTAMSALCAESISPESPESPKSIKLICGLTIGLMAWVTITYAGTEGIKILSVLGGFPVLFLMIWIVIRMGIYIWRKEYTMQHEE